MITLRWRRNPCAWCILTLRKSCQVLSTILFLNRFGNKTVSKYESRVSLLFYVRCLEYCEIEIVGYIPGGIGLPATLHKQPLPSDSKAFEERKELIIGANKTLQINIAIIEKKRTNRHLNFATRRAIEAIAPIKFTVKFY